ncbi:branched chain amino acid ABC transporter substrate-binding protein [Longispora fulva]|uniref:Branched-chain amino acid transport system substrate-binding protein n=1 Tax=Longispora fulva TaxID=619741 RepID=A0A8J7GEC3_9ACTN|nr:branched-chain amino acid ABC transporter substrate-binding protein [Longispora fulva]MBG6134183.1 branched-chain amino acid transport system substrate-binding protein [Longispora fulva]GIG62556.1 branched chain amino acid ABC transporter substrate-binding protein [Longispora fulva]
MKQRFVPAVVVLTAALAATAGCARSGSDGTAASGKDCTVKIAFFGALTGSNAALGINVRDGAKLAIDQYNASRQDTCKIELDNRDSQGDEKVAPGVADAVIPDQKIIGVVGPAFSGESKAAAGKLSENGLTMITIATNPSLSTKGWKTFHRALGNDATQGPAAGRYMQTALKAEKVFIVDDTSEYGKGLADEVRKVVKPVATGTTSKGQTDFSALISAIKASSADAVYYGGYYAEAAPFLKQLRGQGVKAAFVTGDAVKDDKFVEGAGKEAAEGAIITCPCVPPEKSGGTFAADFKKAFGGEPGTYSAESYDAASIFVAGVKAGKTTRKDMEAFVDAYKGQGVTTTFAFTANGEIELSAVAVWAYRVENGRIVAVQEIPKS